MGLVELLVLAMMVITILVGLALAAALIVGARQRRDEESSD